MQGASVKQTRSVCSERARAAAADRSRCGFAKQIRGFSAQCPSQISMRCGSGVLPRPRPINGSPPTRGESNSMQAAGVKQTSRQPRVGCAFLTVVQRKVCPRLSAQNGMHFPDGLLAESSSRNSRPERDMLSGCLLKRKLRPGICPETVRGGQLDRPALLNSKTCAPSIPKLGRRKPKRNRRRST